MKAFRLTLESLLFVSTASSALRGQQGQHRVTPVKSEIGADRTLSKSSLSLNTVFVTVTDEDDRRVPDDAPVNANQDAYAALLNERDVVYQDVEFQPDGANLFVSTRSKAGKRNKGAGLAFDGIDKVVVRPEELNDCDPKMMAVMAVESSTCETLDTTMEGGGVAVERVVPDDGDVPHEERRGEQDYWQELHALTEGGDTNDTLVWGEFDLEERSDRRRLTGLTRNIGIFKPLQCNAMGLPTAAQCDANPHYLMSTLVASAGSGKVIIPCGKCTKYDLPRNSTSTIKGLDILGKLYVPPNYKSTLRTPFVFVQGELQMSDTNLISPDNASMKIILTGTTDVTFTPADSNANVAGTPFNAGSKAFLVAGGKLDIRGWDIAENEERVATWTPLLSMVEGLKPEPTLRAANLAPVPIQLVNTTRICPRVIVDHNFTASVDHSLWSGGEGAIVTHNVEQGTMVLSNIRKSWQGFRLDITKFTVDCPLQANVDYLLTARIKIDKPGMNGQDMPCKFTTNTWNDCPRWARKIMLNVGSDRYSYRSLNQGTIGKYGEWFTFATVWRYAAEDLGSNVIGNIFALENNEPGTTLSMDEFALELPSSKSFPKINDTCSELVVNGNAESADGRGWAFYPMWSSRSGSWEPTITKETLGNGSVNKFFRANNRKWHDDSIRFNMVKGCFVKAMTYWISLRVRVSSVTPISYQVRISGPRADGSGWTNKSPLSCPAQSEADGWVSCSGPYVVEADFDLIDDDIQFNVVFDSNVDKGPIWSVVDYDDVSMTFMAGPAEGLSVDKNIVSRWGSKADVHITSSTISNRDSQNAIIQSVTTNADGRATIKLQTGIDSVLSDKNVPGMGVEVALLSRNIKIEGEAGGTALQGGYFQVFHTLGVAQTIEGVEFTNMGQQQGKNRFSLQFLYSGDVPGTSIARNSIRNSNHRCIVIEGSSNITVEANVAFNTSGHCFYVGSDARDNTLMYNIGSRTNDVIVWGKQLSGESDQDRATFQLYNPRNDYIGNVAAGSDGRGFAIYNDWRTLGEDYVDTNKGSIRRLEMKSFRDNKAHSNTWQGFALYDYEQFLTFQDFQRVPLFENIQSYRNQQHGVYAQNLVAARFIGGQLADNQWGFSLISSDGILIDGMTVRGFTDTLKYITTPTNRQKICSRADWSHEGIRMMTKKNRYGETDPNRGLRLKNVVFSDFDKNTNSCKLGSWPMAFSDIRTDSHFDYTTSLENVTVLDSRGLFIDACTASLKYGVDDIVLHDLDGSLVASIAGTSQDNETPGVFVSNTDSMKFNGCIEYASNCLSFCPDICLRTVTYAVEQFGTEGFNLLITNHNGDSLSIPGKIQAGDYNFFSHAYRPRKFSASLPSGTYTAQFIDEEGNQVWPTYAEELWEAAPDCAMSATPLDVTILKPQIDVSSNCDELIRNGGRNKTLTSSEPWVHTDPGVRVGNTLGINFTDAIVTVNRGGSSTGLGQNIDSQCVDMMKGRYVEFSAWIRMFNKDGSPATNVNPDSIWWNRQSPQLVMNSRQHRDVSTKEFIFTEETNDVAQLARPYNSNGWNLVHGIFRLPSTPHLFVEIDSAPSDVQFYLDDVSMVPFNCKQDQLVRNGNLEDLHVTKYWDTWGEPKLGIVKGYGGSGNAIKASLRSHYSHGPGQVISLDCDVDVGDRLLFSARIKYEAGGVKTTCNIYTWDGSTRCSDIFLYTSKKEVRQYIRVGQIITNDPDADGWYHAHGVLVLNENHITADYAKVYFDGTATSRDVIVDNLEVKVAPKQCSELVLNPSIEDSSFWSYIDRGYGMVSLVPGANGAADRALRSFGRSSSTWTGLRQQLDTRCFYSGAEYEITAKFRLLNSTTSQGVMCDTNVLTNNRGNTQCPSVVIYGWGCTGGDVYWRLWNDIPFSTWNPSNFNDFHVGFVVDDRLASCNTVYVYIHQVNQGWDIVMDSMYISSVDTLSPSFMSTPSPTDDTTGASSMPTSKPTFMPTMATVTRCPDVGSYSLTISPGPVMLGKSDALCILTKAVGGLDGSLSHIAPIARSYDGRPWEPSGGEFARHLLQGVGFGDYDIGTQIILPLLAAGEQYYLTSYSYDISQKDLVARLFETTTFGTTNEDLLAWGERPVTTDSVAEWIREQINKPMTSHREFFRRRVNPRFPNPRPIGRSGHPCDSRSRWRKFTFSKKDGDLWWFDQFLSTSFKEGDNFVTIKLNGHVRTVVNPGAIAFDNVKYTFQYNKVYEMCNLPEERIFGRVYLRVEDNSCQWFQNPVIAFYAGSAQPPIVLNLPNISQSILEPIDGVRSNAGEFIYFDALDDPLCSQLSRVTEQNDSPVFGKLPDGSWLQFDPRLKLEDNNVKSPIVDGGGLVQALTGRQTRCANAPRTFLNEQNCALSFLASSCGSLGAPQLEIELNEENINSLHDMTDQYVYGVLGLPVIDFQGTKLESPCTPGLRSRWEIKMAHDCPTPTILQAATNSTLFNLLTRSSDKNPYIRDITFPTSGSSCGPADTSSLAKVEIVVGTVCYRRVHPEHMSVYDFTYWTLEDTHPGNMVAMMEGEPNPIKKWNDVMGSVFLTYPSFPPGDVPKHSMERWNTHSVHFSRLGRFGDVIKFVDLPNELRTEEVADFFGDSGSIGGAGVLVCGSPNESANDPSLGYQFDVSTGQDTEWGLERQREYVWTMVALNSDDQLRQRVAWALSQILVVVPSAVEISSSYTEAFLTYYDIFVRNAFGNYGDILREISFNPLMAENLSFLQSKSAAYMWETQQKVSFADENFAREIMQLFSTGLYLLNIDGTPKLDENGQPSLVYTNDEIMSFARIWTGFDYQQSRGNVEDSWSGNRHDPMRIQALWRDKFPKSDLLGGYIGDGYPLCVDLPSKMFLRKGAAYRLLGSSSSPELMEDDSNFKTDQTIKKFVLDSSSQLRAKLCNKGPNGSCFFANSVTLESNLSCSAQECDADTLRVVEVSPGIHYEYVRPPCVEQVFYANAKKVINRERWADSSCANPLLPYASEACCSMGDLKAYRSPNYLYDQERVTFSTADSRCLAMGKRSCDFNDIGDLAWYKKGYHWSTDSCLIKVKVNAIGQVALVYEPDDYAYLHPHIDASNRNYFKVYWDGEYPLNDNDVPHGNSCGNGICESLVTGGCLCHTSISKSRVFKAMPGSVDEVLSKLTVGAYDPSAYDNGTYVEQLNANGVTAFLTVAGSFNLDTVFVVADSYGRVRRLKNSKEYVRIQGAPEYAFRNAPSFMSVLNTEAVARDALYETEAALQHYLYHDNTAPFIAYRLIQRFTTSNPTPNYVKAAATAFRTGKYDRFGSGKYGDLEATMAAILLESEARSAVLNADPFFGGVREPLLRVIALMRSMELKQAEGQPIVQLFDMGAKIGMMAHSFPTVFSFYLPEYTPDGRPGDATLVSPEAQIMDMPKTVGLLNGIFSLIKYGLSNCNGGFGGSWKSCSEGNFIGASAYLSFSRPFNSQVTTPDKHADAVINELSTLLTSGRLSAANKLVIRNAYKEKLLDPAGGADSALRLAQQLIATSPEFHTTNTAKLSGKVRSQPEPPKSSGASYKAIVYVMFAGGCDSYNMLVPHTCTGTKDMYAEYAEVREEIAIKKQDLRVLQGAVDNQICESFGVHPKLEAVQGMYNDGDLLFFTNTGVLTRETNKQNYWRDTATQLFAHNWMQREAQRVDPLKEEDGTGILGRIADALTRKGLNVGSFAIDVNAISLIGFPGVSPPPFILSRSGVSKFNNGASSASMDLKITSLNEATTPHSGVFGELWSSKLLKSLTDNKNLYDTLAGKKTNVTFPTSYLGSQLEMVAKMIDSRAERGADADVFFLQTGGWDTHSDVQDNLNTLFGDVDASFNAFSSEMKAKGTWKSVTVIETSDFARTLAPNTGHGSDHAWGGNYMMFGGGVKGKQIVGSYPDDLTDDGDLSLGRGRMIPTTSWDAVFLPLAEWVGVGSSELDWICPNRDNFPASHFMNAADLFKST